jgi:formate hydrogenlyase transcriptional activator
MQLKTNLSINMIAETEKQYQQLMEALPIATLAIRDGCVIYANQECTRIFGFSGSEEMIGLSALDFVAPESQQLIAERIKRFEEGQDNPTTEIELLRRDGSRFIAESTSVSILLEGEHVGGIALRDITRIKESEKVFQERFRFQELISDISAKFINPSDEKFEQTVQDALAKIAEYFDVDAVRLYRLSFQGDVMELRNSWRSPALAPPEEMPGLHQRKYPNFAAHYSKGESVVFSRYDDSPDWPEMRDVLKFLGVKAGIGVPLEVDASGVDIFAMDKVLTEYEWPEDTVEHTKAVGRVMLGVMRRREAETELHDSMDEIKRLKDRLEQENIYLRVETGAGYHHDKIIGDSEAIKEALAKARQVADTDTTVLITGETGTGKELFAQAIHDLSGRKGQLIVKLNCAALPPTLVEGELFGREKGAYTGAMTSQVGRFELADGSTIFLDEIGELTPDLQVKLLRVIEDGTFERLGSSSTINTDVRIIAATNSDLQEMISEGRFREDLYYRLNVFPIRVPPLRERPSDVPQLAWTFIRELESRMGKRIQTIPEDVMVGLIGYSWPGNVRELRNVIEHAMILSPGPVLQAHLPEDKTAMDTETQGMTLDEVNRRHILRALEQTNWRIQGKGGAAQLMGVKPNTLRSRMEKLGIKKSR